MAFEEGGGLYLNKSKIILSNTSLAENKQKNNETWALLNLKKSECVELFAIKSEIIIENTYISLNFEKNIENNECMKNDSSFVETNNDENTHLIAFSDDLLFKKYTFNYNLTNTQNIQMIDLWLNINTSFIHTLQFFFNLTFYQTDLSLASAIG